MSAPSFDAEYEAQLRRVIREELEAERDEVEAAREEREAARESRANRFWWAASLIFFGPFAIAGAAVLWVGAFALDLGAKAIWAVRRRRAPADPEHSGWLDEPDDDLD
jgi:hypothetical protein